MNAVTFANPWFLLLLLFILPALGWYIWKGNSKESALQVSDVRGFMTAGRTWRYYLRHLVFALRMIVFSAIVIVLARPQSTNRWSSEVTEGIDIVLALDISGSMLAEDFKPNRLEASKDVAISFINNRPNDRIGLVIFAGESFTQCPLTTDHAVLINLLNEIRNDMLEDGTAIGNGLATAVTRLKDSKAKGKVIILLTDGVSNKGSISPVTAGEIARTFNIRVYTIGVGTMGMAPYPVRTPFGIQYQQMEVEIDEDVLRQIAQMTEANYYRATNNQKLKEIYAEIDKLEKIKIDEKRFSEKKEEYLLFGILAGIALLLEIIIRNTILRTIP